MKDLLNNYYDINIDTYKQYGAGIIFVVNGDNYYFYKIEDSDIKVIDELIQKVLNKTNMRLHSIVLNKNGDVLSDGFVLLKLNVLPSEVDYNDLKKFVSCNMNEYKKDYIDFRTVWMNKIDLLEKKLNECSIEQVINESFDYFDGIVEILIKFLGNVDLESTNLVLSHKKNYNNTIDYYNPFNLTIDLPYRDLVFYLKNNNNEFSIYDYIGFDNKDVKYVFARMAMPFEYFELIDRYLSNEDVKQEISLLIDNIDLYEDYLYNLQMLFNFYVFDYLKRSN